MKKKPTLRKGIKLWYDDQLWQVIDIIHPNKFHTLLHLLRFDKLYQYEDGTTYQYHAIVDTNSFGFYPDIKVVRDLMKSIVLLKRELTCNSDRLLGIWYDQESDAFRISPENKIIR